MHTAYMQFINVYLTLSKQNFFEERIKNFCVSVVPQISVVLNLHTYFNFQRRGHRFLFFFPDIVKWYSMYIFLCVSLKCYFHNISNIKHCHASQCKRQRLYECNVL